MYIGSTVPLPEDFQTTSLKFCGHLTTDTTELMCVIPARGRVIHVVGYEELPNLCDVSVFRAGKYFKHPSQLKWEITENRVRVDEFNFKYNISVICISTYSFGINLNTSQPKCIHLTAK